MKTWIVSSLDEETIQGEELYEEISYMNLEWAVNLKTIILKKLLI